MVFLGKRDDVVKLNDLKVAATLSRAVGVLRKAKKAKAERDKEADATPAGATAGTTGTDKRSSKSGKLRGKSRDKGGRASVSAATSRRTTRSSAAAVSPTVAAPSYTMWSATGGSSAARPQQGWVAATPTPTNRHCSFSTLRAIRTGRGMGLASSSSVPTLKRRPMSSEPVGTTTAGPMVVERREGRPSRSVLCPSGGRRVDRSRLDKTGLHRAKTVQQKRGVRGGGTGRLVGGAVRGAEGRVVRKVPEIGSDNNNGEEEEEDEGDEEDDESIPADVMRRGLSMGEFYKPDFRQDLLRQMRRTSYLDPLARARQMGVSAAELARLTAEALADIGGEGKGARERGLKCKLLNRRESSCPAVFWRGYAPGSERVPVPAGAAATGGGGGGGGGRRDAEGPTMSKPTPDIERQRLVPSRGVRNTDRGRRDEAVRGSSKRKRQMAGAGRRRRRRRRRRRYKSLPPVFDPSVHRFTLLRDLRAYFDPAGVNTAAEEEKEEKEGWAGAGAGRGRPSSPSEIGGHPHHLQHPRDREGLDFAALKEYTREEMLEDPFSDMNLLKRESLKFEPLLQHILHDFWRLVDSDGNGKLDQSEYVALSVRMQRVVTPKEMFVLRRALTVAKQEWIGDSQGHAFLNRSRFYNALFQAADAWADSITAAAYEGFLSKLLGALSRVHKDGVRRWRFKRHQGGGGGAGGGDTDDAARGGGLMVRQRTGKNNRRVPDPWSRGVPRGIGGPGGGEEEWLPRRTFPRSPRIDNLRHVHPRLRAFESSVYSKEGGSDLDVPLSPIATAAAAPTTAVSPTTPTGSCMRGGLTAASSSPALLQSWTGTEKGTALERRMGRGEEEEKEGRESVSPPPRGRRAAREGGGKAARRTETTEKGSNSAETSDDGPSSSDDSNSSSSSHMGSNSERSGRGLGTRRRGRVCADPTAAGFTREEEARVIRLLRERHQAAMQDLQQLVIQQQQQEEEDQDQDRRRQPFSSTSSSRRRRRRRVDIITVPGGGARSALPTKRSCGAGGMAANGGGGGGGGGLGPCKDGGGSGDPCAVVGTAAAAAVAVGPHWVSSAGPGWDPLPRAIAQSLAQLTLTTTTAPTYALGASSPSANPTPLSLNFNSHPPSPCSRPSSPPPCVARGCASGLLLL